MLQNACKRVPNLATKLRNAELQVHLEKKRALTCRLGHEAGRTTNDKQRANKDKKSMSLECAQPLWLQLGSTLIS
jgi:hypothetical protein